MCSQNHTKFRVFRLMSHNSGILAIPRVGVGGREAAIQRSGVRLFCSAAWQVHYQLMRAVRVVRLHRQAIKRTGVGCARADPPAPLKRHSSKNIPDRPEIGTRHEARA
jgi:hypothetical protein